MKLSSFILKFLLSAIALLLVSSSAFSQYQFDTWTTDRGLPQNGVREITQTPEGYLWFTTFDGLVRFDGVKFTTFNKGNADGIINNRFTGIYSDESGAIYATTMEDGILTVYRDGKFTSYDSKTVPGQYIKQIQPGENGGLRLLVEDQDGESESWYAFQNGEFSFREKREKLSRTKEYRGASGSIWKINPNEVIEFRGGVSVVYPIETEGFDFTKEFFEDSSGGLWIGGIQLIYLKNGEIQRFGTKEGLMPFADFHSFWEETDGVWFANGGKSGPGVGLVRYKDGEFSIFGKDAGLSDTSIYNVFKDREGTVWLATNKGLNRLKRRVIQTLSTNEGLDSPEVYPVLRDRKGQIWVGSIKGLNVFKDGRFEQVNLKPKRFDVPKHTIWRNGEVSIQSLMEDSNGRLWIGVAGGIFIIDEGSAEMIGESEGFHVNAFLQDRSGTVWVATNKGVLTFNDYKLTRIYSLSDGLANEFSVALLEDSAGKIWVGGLGGLARFDGGKFSAFTENEGLTGNYVRTIFEDNEKTLWIGTYDEGFSRFKDGKFTNYRTDDGLFNNGAFAIEEDRHGHFWISSNRGIYRVNRNELNEFADGKIDKINSVGYGREDGMLNTECNGGRQPASVRDELGRFWFPTQDGVAVVDPNSETVTALPPNAVIESVTVERKPVDFRQGITIDPGQKNVEITYTGLSLIKSGQIKFRYKLEGHDQDWIDAGTQRTAYYSYLPPGNYRFFVKAASSSGVWNETPAVINIERIPYFYQTNWFYILCAVGAAVFVVAVWLWSVYSLRSRAELLRRLVDEKTLELKKANENLVHLANHDALTKLANRRYFEEFLKNEWQRAVRSQSDISLIILDIDHFKAFNDTYGHLAGDNCLWEVAAAIKSNVKRPTDLAARIGGEEFAVVLGKTDSEGAFEIAEQISESIRKSAIVHATSPTDEFLTISVGVATVKAELDQPESRLVSFADKALYAAKEGGRNRIEVYGRTDRSVLVPAPDSEITV